MELSPFFKSIVEQETDSIVICNTEHTIIYMNPTALKRYEKRGGAALIGRSIKMCHNAHSNDRIDEVMEWFEKDSANNIMYLYYKADEYMDAYMVALRDDDAKLIGYYEKHCIRNRETAQPYNFG